MKKRLSNHTSVMLFCFVSVFCFVGVCIAVLYTPNISSKHTGNTSLKVEYIPPARETDRILLCCNDCKKQAVLELDYKNSFSSLTTFSEQNGFENNISTTAKITFDHVLICSLVDKNGGVNFTLYEDTEVLEKGNWRLSGNQVAQLLHKSDSVTAERLTAEIFYQLFMFGLQKEQVYIIINKCIDISLSYSELYSVAHHSSDWLCDTAVTIN